LREKFQQNLTERLPKIQVDALSALFDHPTRFESTQVNELIDYFWV